ncbi:hypothetical protein FKM82_016114 [Ascaphus truei]
MASVVDLKSKEEKDAELDRKIEALRKKNEALVRRHQLIQEDRMRAEQEGIAVTTPRKAKHQETEPDKARKEKENFSITVNVSNSAEPEKRIINDGRSPKTAQPSPGFETSPKSPTRRSSGRTGPFPGVRSPHMDWPGERSPHMDWPGEHFEVEGDGVNPAERAARGRRSQGRGGSRRGPRGSEDASPGERGDRWTSALSPRGGAAPGERGGRVPGRGGGVLGRGDGPGGGGDGVIGPDKKNKEWEEKRRQNIEKMNKEKEQNAEYERSRRKEEKVEEPQKELKVEEVTETADDEAEDEWEDASEEEGEEEEAVSETDSSGAEEDLVEEKLPSTSPVTPQPAAKEQRQPLHTETPKLTMPLPAENPDEKATESYPTTPFSPDGYQPVSDWGEEMELQSPRVSSSDDSPPQAANMKTSAVDKRTSRADSTPAEPASGAPTVDGFQKPIESLAQNLAEVLETASENLTDGLESGSLESTDTKRKSDQQEEIQSTQSWTEEEAIGKTSTFSSAGQLEQPTAADGKEEGNFPGAEESEAATGAVLITDFETQRTEVPLAS